MIMILDETNQYIKDNLEVILSGGWDNKFDKDQIKYLTEFSFILNHLNVGIGFFQFEYGDFKLKIRLDNLKSEYMFESVMSTIKNDDSFKSAFKSFLRDRKIENLGI